MITQINDDCALDEIVDEKFTSNEDIESLEHLLQVTEKRVKNLWTIVESAEESADFALLPSTRALVWLINQSGTKFPQWDKEIVECLCSNCYPSKTEMSCHLAWN